MENINLVGSEDVARAGSTISSAAETMTRAAGSVDDGLFRFMQVADLMIERLELVMDRAEALYEKANPPEE